MYGFSSFDVLRPPRKKKLPCKVLCNVNEGDFLSFVYVEGHRPQTVTLTHSHRVRHTNYARSKFVSTPIELFV